MTHRQRGFTLVEIMVVVLIITILLGIVLVNPVVNSVHQVMQTQVSRLQLLFSQLRDKALIKNEEFGFSISVNGSYNWWHFSNQFNKWSVLTQSPYQLFEIPRVTVHLSTDMGDNDEYMTAQPERPSIIFFSDGTVTPFYLKITPISKKEQALTLHTDGLSNVTIVHKNI